MKYFCITAPNFNLAHTLECGQVFRWNKIGNNEYEGVIEQSIVRIRQDKERLFIQTSRRPSINPSFIKSYFDLTLDLPYIYNTIGKDKHIKAAIKRFYGLRIIRQPLWECLASFIISTRNNIPRIKKIINKLSECAGKRLVLNGVVRHSFPDAQAFANSTICQLKGCGAGYRAAYLKKTAQVFLEKKLCVEGLKGETYNKAKEELKQLKGVGDKVADCVLLFSVGKLEAFPIDVWVKRIMEKLYFNGKKTNENEIREFAKEYFGEYAGYAQQYLYYYARKSKVFKGSKG